MIIKFSNDLSDARALALFHYRMSPTLRKSRRKVQIVSALIVPVLAAFGYFDIFSSEAGLWMVGAIIWVLFVGFHHRHSFVKKSTSIYRERDGEQAFGKHELSLDQRGVTVTTEGGNGFIPYERLAQVIRTDKYTFIYVDAIRALILPKSKVTGGDFDSFTAELRNRFERAMKEKKDKSNGNVVSE